MSTPATSATRFPGAPSREVILSALLTEVFELPAHETLGVGADLARKELERFRKQLLSDDRSDAIERAIIDRLLGFDRQHEAEPRRVALDRHLLVRALRTFLDDNDRIADTLGDDFVGNAARRAWVEGVVVTRLALGLCELIRRNPALDAGMPRGIHWYSPRIRLYPTPREGGRTYDWDTLPCAQVLAWWEDLLGHPLEGYGKSATASVPDFLELVYGDKFDRKSAREEVRDWKSGVRTMSPKKIIHWTAAGLPFPYAGTFTDNPDAPLADRWRRARDFIGAKTRARTARDIPGDWLGQAGATGTPELFCDQYTSGHWLELELPVFTNPRIPVTAFLVDNAPDNPPDGMSLRKWHGHIATFVSRVAERWRAPDLALVRSRLLLASASQRAVLALAKFDPESAKLAVIWFEEAYTRLMASANDAQNRPGADDSKVFTALRVAHIDKRQDAPIAQKMILSAALIGAQGDRILHPVLRLAARLGTTSQA